MKGCVVEDCGRCDAGESHRIYFCARCGKLVRICRRCDRGNIYCASGCAEQSRSESKRRSNEKNQKTPQGRLKHAERQARYRQGLQEKVTEQGSEVAPPLPKQDGKQALVTELETSAEVAVESEDQATAELESNGFNGFEFVPDESTSHDGSREPSTPLDAFFSPEVDPEPRCDFCGRQCGVYSRNGFLRRR